MTSMEFDDLNEQMLTRFFTINPDEATAFGKHDPFDGQLPDGSVKRLEDTLKLLKDWESEATKIANKGELSEDQKISFEVLRMSAKIQDFSLNDFQEWRMFPDALEMPGTVMFLMISRDYAPYEKRAEWMSSRTGQLPRYLEEFRTRFDKGGKPIRPWTEHSIATCEGFPGFLDFILEHSKGKVPDSLWKKMSTNVDAAKSALMEHLEWLRDLLGKSTDDLAMGPRKLEELLKIRGFSLTAEEMLAIARRGLEETKKLRADAARRISPGDPSKALRIIRDDTPASFDLALDETKKEMAKARKWIVEHGVCSIDYRGDVQVKETPEFLRMGVPTAALMMPAVFDKEPQGIYLVTRAESFEDVKQLCNRSGIINTTVHEAFPGHYHQGAMSFKKPWMHQLHLMLMSGDVMISGYETMEGWALYCEKMMYDKGYGANDRAYYVMLDYIIWRACRVIYDISICRGDATVEEMIEFFMKETDTSREITAAEIEGFSRTPAYALSYFTGKYLLLGLKDSLRKELGSRFDEKKFHDLFAMNGNLPFNLAERSIRIGMGASV